MKTILIIEDDERIVSALRIRFESQGYGVCSATDAIVGFNLALRRNPHLIVLDISLPGGNGLALAQRLRTFPETGKTPIILITANKDPDLRCHAMELRAAGLFEKPYNADELMATARFALGDTMTFALPRLAPERPETLAPPCGSPRKILIVEDDPKIALALAVRLKSAGYEATVAGDALTAVNTALRIRPDLVLLDLSLPAGHGFTVAERLQTLIPTPTPVIFLTANKEPGLRQRAAELGAADFFEKPYEPEELLASIQRASVHSRGALRELPASDHA
jgi:DNA-binding response OmpR family regulator